MIAPLMMMHTIRDQTQVSWTRSRLNQLRLPRFDVVRRIGLCCPVRNPSKLAVLVILASLLISGLQSVLGADQPGQATQPEIIKYRLVRVIIPPDSPYRNEPRFKKTPDLFVIVKKDGKEIGESGSNEGWEVEYNATKKHNLFEIDNSDTASYSIELWDYYHVYPSTLVLTITGLKAADFAQVILEHLGKLDDNSRATRIEFTKCD